MAQNRLTAGTLLITLVALWAAGGSYIFDWNSTHIYNPQWPPHAKFHNAQTMLLGTCLGLSSLYMLWLNKGDLLSSVRVSAILASLYWLTQAGAILFPGTALTDPEFSHPGEPPHQMIVDVVMLLMLTTGYLFTVRRFKRQQPGIV